MTTLKTSEQLQEALLHLELTRLQEQKLREESDAILQGLASLVGAGSRQEVLTVLQQTFQKLIGCQHCWVLQVKDGILSSDIEQLSFTVDKAFRRVLDGHVLNVFDVSHVPEWQGITIEGVVSALHLPLQLASSKGMLIITSDQRGAFSRESIELVQRIIPFCEQAASKIELIEQVHEQEMDKQRKLMQQILDHAPIGVFLLDENRRVKFVNQAFCALVGVSEAQFMAAEHYSDILPESVSKQCMASDDRCLQEQGPVKSIETMPCVDGREHIFDIIKMPLKSSDSDAMSIIGIAVDITEKIEREAEKEHMQQQLLHTQKLESLGVLAGGIAHDFNNILTAIMGHAALAETKFVNDPLAVEQHLHKIVGATEKAADLCKQMLAYSGHGKFVVKPVNLSALIESVINILEVSLNKGVILKLSLTDHLPMVEADASQIHQVIMNLVTNANEAIDTISGVISVRTGVMHADKSYLSQCLCDDSIDGGHFVFIEVADTGCGMTMDVIEKIFDPFYTTKFTGRGLGMSAVLGIVRGHHGALKLYSEPGQGTTFRVLFPALNYESSEQTEADVELQRDIGGSVVLVVDDEESIREITVMMLQDAGISNVLTAADGKEALDIYRQRDDIDLVLLDLTMPHMDGEEAFRQLRLLNPSVKVILASGYSEQSIHDRFAGKGLCGVIQKPYQPDALANIVKQTLVK